MNRPGQPPQRPPSLAPNPALGAPFRNQFTNYGMPPRNVIPGFHQLGNHRTAQTIVPQPSPNYLQQQQRAQQSNFPFGASLPQQQQSHAPLQHNPQSSLPHTPLQPTQPQNPPSSNSNAGLPPHLQQNAIGSLGTVSSVSSTSEVGLDPNDFPALGSTPSNALNTPSTTNATSYATQAGTGVGVAGNGAQGASGASQQRDFGPDDFPALGGQTQSSQATQQQPPTADGHPPGLNGFQQSEQQHRNNLLGSLAGGQPGLLNLGQTRGFQSEADKRNYTLKLNQAAVAAAWNSPNANPSAQTTTAFPATSNGAHPPSSQIPSSQPQTQTPLGAPPGVPPPSSFSQPPQQQTPYVGNGTAADTTQGSAQPSSAAVPQTPAQQVLMSPADKWGLLGLLAIIKSSDLDSNLLSIGTDLGTMGLDMQTSGLYSTFITPWSDSSAAHTVEPDFHLPSCYQVTTPTPGPQKAQAFSDETLFYMFYASPRDALQEVAAFELYGRNWRFHKDLRLWITKESGTSPSQKVLGGERGTYSYWDPENWEKNRKEMTVVYSDLEEKSLPNNTTLPLNATAPQAQTPPVSAQPPQQMPRAQGGFQQMGISAM
ncbi:hypothetical protein QCA50_006540 [Cerrena zonata]|uniref:NOT2/NOT3/NOT5 C-terminal domain-containing protein n=1 Tax=Cerrena zonata TaxID=2478898 RepID=A0AAW0G962_9APHY